MNSELARAIVEQDDTGVCVIQGGEIIETNSRLQELIGHTEAELHDKASTALIPSEFQDVLDILDQGYLSDDSSGPHKIAIKTASRGRIPATLTITEITYEGTPTLILRINSDAPAGGQQLPSDGNVLLEECEMIFENTQDALFLLDVDSDETIRFRRFNQNQEDFTGKSSAEIRGKTPVEAFGDELGAELEANYRACLDKQRPICYEETIELEDESTVWQTQLTPVIVDGDVTHIVGAGREVTELRESQRELEQQKALLEQAQEVADLGAWELDMRADDGWWSQKVNEIYGLPPDELIRPEEAIEYFHPADQAEMREAFTRLREDGEPYDVELRLHPDDDDEKWVRAIGRPVFEDGDIVALRGTIEDITERKQRETELKRLKERLELAVDGANLGVWDWNPQTDEVQFNDNWATMLGYDPEEIGSTLAEWEQRVHPDDIDGVEAALETHLAGESEYYETEHRMRTADDDWKWIRDIGRVVERDNEGQPLRAVGIHIDITDRKEYEQALDQTQRNLRQIIDLVPDLIFVKNREGEYLLANEATAEMYGRNVAEIEGKHEQEVIPDVSESEGFRVDDRAVIDSGEPTEIPEEELTTAAGERKILQTTKIPYEPSGSGEPAVLGYARDVTTLKENEQALERQRDNLDLLNGVVRHDIRNYLQLLQGNLERLEEHVTGEGSAFITEGLENVRSAIDVTTTAREVSDALLQQTNVREPVNLTRILRSEVEDVQANHDQAAVRIAEPLPEVDVMANELLGSAIRNLLTNAIVHNDKETPEVTVTASVNDDIARIQIADNGPGIPDVQKTDIFDQAARGLESPGTGLGLYLVKTLIEQYDGSIRVADNEPEGCTFSVEVPLANDNRDQNKDSDSYQTQ